jgi:hypothetical protein
MWLHEGKEYTADDVPKDAVGFVYLITNKENGMKYIGKKKFYRTIKRPPLKGKKRKRIEIVQSDWEEYVGSNNETKLLKEEHGLGIFKREIIHICSSLGVMSYLEAKEQFDRDVLLRDDYYNGIIQCRINHKHVKALWK